jgi:CheY-like chemotaxis protein
MKRKKILIIDDEHDILTYLKILFQDEGYDTITSDCGSDGLEIAKQEQPDLITLDITMPGQSGVRTFRYFKQNDALKHIPVIVITATGDSTGVFLKNLAGLPEPDGFIGKPVDKDTLIRLASDLLSKCAE